MEYDDVTTIATPEGVDLHLTLAGVGSRFVSALLDALIQGVVTLGLALALLGGAAITGLDGDLAVAIFVLAAFLLVAAYDIGFEVLASGRTPGKRLNGLRVVRVGGEPIGFLASAVRNILRLIDMLPGAYLVGCISILASPKNQRVGDLVAGTIVVRDRRAASPGLPPVLRRATDADAAVAWDTSAITAEELSTVRSFLERRWEIEYEARYQLGSTLAARLRPKVGGAPDGQTSETFLEALAAAKTARR